MDDVMTNNTVNDDSQTVKLIPEYKQRTIGSCFPIRYVISWLLFGMFTIFFAMRSCVNFAIVSMVNMTKQDDIPTADKCPGIGINGSGIIQYNGTLEWSPEIQDYVLGSFYWGYMILQVPGGFIAEKFSARKTIGICILFESIGSLLSPYSASISPYLFISVRIFMGLLAGPIIPSASVIISKWSPIHERGKMSTIAFTGMSVGWILGSIATGYLCDSSFLGGWPSAFYLFGILGCIVSTLWLVFARDAPSSHWLISESEVAYIRDHNEDMANVKYLNPPWIKLLTSVPLWAFMIAQWSREYQTYVIGNMGPLFLEQMQGVSLAKDGIIFSIISCSSVVCCFISGIISDKIMENLSMNITTLRKLTTFILICTTGSLVLCMGYFECNFTISSILMISTASVDVFHFISGLQYVGFEIAPLYTGTIFGIVNCFSSSAGFIVPLIFTSVTNCAPSRHAWKIGFIISFCIAVFGAFFFVIFGSSEEVSWAKELRLQGLEKTDSNTSNGEEKQVNSEDYLGDAPYST